LGTFSAEHIAQRAADALDDFFVTLVTGQFAQFLI